MKMCTKCGKVKRLGEFGNAKGGAGGKSARCKQCHLAYKRELYHRRNPDAPYADRPHYSRALGCIAKICSACKIEKPVTAFYRRPGGYHGRCKMCDDKANKARYDADPEKYRAKAREWARANPERHRARFHAWVAANHEYRLHYFRWSAFVKGRAKRARDIEVRRQWPRERLQAYYAKCGFNRMKRLRNVTREWIDRAAIIERDKGICYLCGIAPKVGDLTLDHVIPLARGGSHTADNIRVACRRCNSRKGTKLLADYLALAG